MASILSVLAAGVRVLAGLAALACLVTALAGQCGRWSDRLDLVNHATPLVLVAALLAGMAWLVLGGRGAAIPLVAGLAAGLCAAQMAPDVLARLRPKPAAAGPTVKLIQFNVWHSNPTPDRAADWLLAQDADVVVLEETNGRGGQIPQRLKDRYPHRSSCNGHSGCATVILSRRPLSVAHAFPYVPAAIAELDTPAGPLMVVGVHFVRPYPGSEQQAQSRRLSDALSTLAKNRMVLAGDFNATP